MAAWSPAGFAMYDTMQFIKAPVHTLCMGTARSMGSFLLMAGEPGHRAALAQCQPSRAPAARRLPGPGVRHPDPCRRRCSETKRRITRLYAQHCGRPEEEVERTLDRDHFMTAQQALAWGLIDKVLRGTRCRLTGPRPGLGAAGARRPGYFAARRGASVELPIWIPPSCPRTGQDYVRSLACPRLDQTCLFFKRDGIAQFGSPLRNPEKPRIHKPLGKSAVLARHLILRVLAVPAK